MADLDIDGVVIQRGVYGIQRSIYMYCSRTFAFASLAPGLGFLDAPRRAGDRTSYYLHLRATLSLGHSCET